jgi:lipopolysaccharide/colanic/teichoic acid biosynthesis glycosyltransferase
MLDVVLSFLGIIILSPVFLIVIILIQIEEPGSSIVYTQTRVGKNGKKFRMYKFRSMREHSDVLVSRLRAENGITGVTFKMKDDPRVTKIGGFMRKHSIDELLQLFNVLRGNMSLVGPRPALPEEVLKYSVQDFERLEVLPGCTGIWQVSGRNAVSFDKMVELDNYYVEHHSVWLDIKIMFKTVKIVFLPNDAY